MKLLLLGGTFEARALADRLAGHPRIAATLSLAGATRVPMQTALPTRIGGFGGDDGFVSWLDTHRPDAILDATHPFAARISARTHRIAAARGLPHLQILRPPWRPQPGDDWTEIAQEEELAHHLDVADRVFLATGRQSLDRFSRLQVDHMWCRQIDPPDRPFPLPRGEFIIGRPPFSVVDEFDLFARLRITALVVKNAGGEAPRAKLIAARQLGIPVYLIARPAPSGAPSVETVDQAMAWLDIV